jgi:hypothetical protein
MTKPMIRIHNQSTDEIIDREMTDEEFAEWDQEQNAKQSQLEAQNAAKASAIAKLAALGLTEDEAKAIFG